MRIVSGSHKGRKIKAPKNLPIRPTTDMSKESITDISLNSYKLDKMLKIDSLDISVVGLIGKLLGALIFLPL